LHGEGVRGFLGIRPIRRRCLQEQGLREDRLMHPHGAWTALMSMSQARQHTGTTKLRVAMHMAGLHGMTWAWPLNHRQSRNRSVCSVSSAVPWTGMSTSSPAPRTRKPNALVPTQPIGWAYLYATATSSRSSMGRALPSRCGWVGNSGPLTRDSQSLVRMS